MVARSFLLTHEPLQPTTMDAVFKIPSAIPQDLLLIQDIVGAVGDTKSQSTPIQAASQSDNNSIASSEEDTASEDEVDDLLVPGSPKACGPLHS